MNSHHFDYQSSDQQSIRVAFELSVRFDEGQNEYMDEFMSKLKIKLSPLFSLNSASELKARGADHWDFISGIIKKNMNDNAREDFEPYEVEDFKISTVSHAPS